MSGTRPDQPPPPPDGAGSWRDFGVPDGGYNNSVKSKDFIISSGADTGALWGCFLEVVVALAGHVRSGP